MQAIASPGYLEERFGWSRVLSACAPFQTLISNFMSRAEKM